MAWMDFIGQIRNAREKLGAPETVWYRGQAKTSYSLTPSLLRRSDGIAKERLLFDEYEQYANHLQGRKENDWELLSDMQHHGIPTRLLDWTDVLGVAVAFALYDSNDDNIDSSVYVLDPLALNKMSGVDEIKRAANDPEFSYKNVYWRGRPFAPIFPIAVDTIYHNDRLRAQRGGFTIQGRDIKPIDQQAPNAVLHIVLPATAKLEAREFLEHANINAFSLYPDIVGMAQHITRRYLS